MSSRKNKLILICLIFCQNIIVGQLPFNCDSPPEGIGGGSDKIICLGHSTVIGGCLNGDFLIEWVSVPYDLNLAGQNNFPELIVSPSESTTYILTLTDPNNPENYCIDFVYVIVLDDGEINIGIEDADVNTSLEAMEGRIITFEVNMNADLPEGYDEESSNLAIQYNFHYNDADEVTMNEEVVAGYSLNVKSIISTDNVLITDLDDKYQLSVSVSISNLDESGCDLLISPLTVDVYRLNYDYLRDGEENKNWKVRVNEEIEYNAIAASQCINWEWSMRDQDDNGNELWNMSGGDSKSGIMTIHNSSLPTKNKYFGDDYGTVYLKCEDVDGNMFERYSDEDINDNKKTKIFYVGADLNIHDSTLPNWFYYYKDEEGGGNATYNYGCGGPMGGTSYSYPGAQNDAYIWICDNAYEGGAYLETQIQPGPPSQLKTTGFYCTPNDCNKYYKSFISVLTHEREHCHNQVPTSHMEDTDNDNLITNNEYQITHTNPILTYSAIIMSWPNAPDGFNDGEVYAGGPIERIAYQNADDSEDWAAPGGNW